MSIRTSHAQVTVTATAGTVGPTSYTTVNSAFTAINAGTHQGNITVTITGNTTEPATCSVIKKWNSFKLFKYFNHPLRW